MQLPVGMKAKGEWKIAQSQEIDDEGDVSQYDHDVTFRKILSVLPDAGQGILKVECQISFQACNESLCLPVTTKVICATVNLVDR